MGIKVLTKIEGFDTGWSDGNNFQRSGFKNIIDHKYVRLQRNCQWQNQSSTWESFQDTIETVSDL